MVSKWVISLFINGIYWAYNPLTNHLLTSWDIQVCFPGTSFLFMARQGVFLQPQRNSGYVFQLAAMRLLVCVVFLLCGVGEGSGTLRS